MAIRGARPGMTLQVDIGELVPGAWGACLAGGWDGAHNRRMGVVGDGVVHAYTFARRHGHEPPRPHACRCARSSASWGCRRTRPASTRRSRRASPAATSTAAISSPGSTLYLPIAVDGALFSCGDGHAAQGDGEVSGTAIECPMERAELTFHLSDRALDAPLARTAEGWVTFGLDADLNAAAQIALEAMLALLGREYGLSRRDALAVASVEVDLRITQIVNEVQGVHAVLTVTVRLGLALREHARPPTDDEGGGGRRRRQPRHGLARGQRRARRRARARPARP